MGDTQSLKTCITRIRNIEHQRVLLADLFAVVEEHAGEAAEEIDRRQVEEAFVFACDRHADQRRASGEDFIIHPVGVAKICAGMRLDTATLCAALLHDTVEDTSASLDEVREDFSEEVCHLVDGVTKLSGVTFQSRDDRQAENYRKMMVAMAQDIRVILIKLADRLHNMRTIGAMPKPKQQEKAKETLEILRRWRTGSASTRSSGSSRTSPSRRSTRASTTRSSSSCPSSATSARPMSGGRASTCARSLPRSASRPTSPGRAKHFYSIYSKMTKKGREFNEIYDLTAMRVIVESVKDCYGAIGVIHSLWKPLPGRFKDWVAMPKFNMYQALHTTVIGPEGRPSRSRSERWRCTAPPSSASRRTGSTRRTARSRSRKGRVAAPPARLAAGRLGPPGVRRDAQGRPLRGRGLRLHAQGRGQVARLRRHAARLRLRDPHGRGPPLRGGQGQRQDRPAPLHAPVRATSSRC